MLRFILFVAIGAPLLMGWGAYHAFIKKDFAAIKSDFTIGLAYLLFAGAIFYLISCI